MSLLAAKSRATQAREHLGNGRLDLVESTIATGEKFLVGLPDGETAELRAEFAAIRADLAAVPTDVEQRMLTAAKGKIRSARNGIADKNLYSVEGALEGAAKYLADVREHHRAAVMAEIEAVKKEYAAAVDAERKPAPAPAPAPAPVAAPAQAAPAAAPAPSSVTVNAAIVPTPSSTSAPALPAVDQASVSRADGHLRSARSLVEAGRDDGVEHHLEQALAVAATLPPHVSDPMRAQADATRRALAELTAAERARRATGEIGRHLSRAEGDIEQGDYLGAEHVLAQLAERIEADDLKQGLSPEQHAQYKSRIAELRLKAAATLKAIAFDRALPMLGELEHMVAADPFAGLDQDGFSHRSHELNYLRQRVLGSLHHVPDSDADVRAVLQRLVTVEQLIEAGAARWGKAVADAEVVNTWTAVAAAIEGWEKEPIDQDTTNFFEPAMPATRTAMQRTRVFLADPRSKESEDTAVQESFQVAERVFQECTAKLATAYSNVLAAAERIESPMNQMILARPSLIALGAEAVFAGTPFQAVITTRARKLDERWKSEVAAIMKARQELYDELAAEAELKWPRIRETFGTVELRGAQPGELVRLDRVYNRYGWDYGRSSADFAVRVGNVVYAGSYASHVLEALEHAWYEQKLDVNDRIQWDVIAVIEGPDKIGIRTKVTLRDKSSGAVLGELEEWPPIDCTRIRIIGLHAGPVVVAQQP
jgi:hypothetical protein